MAGIDFARVFDAMPAASAVLSPDLVILAVNRAFEEVTGRDRTEVVGRHGFEVFPVGPSGRGGAEIRASFERVLTDHAVDVMALQRYDVEVPEAPGTYQERYWNVVNAPVPGPDGEVELIVLRSEDVTGFIHQIREAGVSEPPASADTASARMRAFEAELFTRARELQEVNQRLRRAQADERQTIHTLRRAMSRQREVVADTSHDLKGPITGLQTRLESALDDPDTDLRQILLAALQDAQRLGDIVAELLELARLESGAPLATDPIDLAHLVETELARRRPAVSVTTRLRPGAVVRGSVVHLARLLDNLMNNAERHARTRVEVAVTTTPGWAVLEVIDDGPGIPDAERAAVFSRFHRRADARRSDPGGTGLGLPIARQIADLHGGTLDIADHATGARLVLRLPLRHTS